MGNGEQATTEPVLGAPLSYPCLFVAAMPSLNLPDGVVPFPGCPLTLSLNSPGLRLALASALTNSSHQLVLMPASDVGLIADVRAVTPSIDEASFMPVRRIRRSTEQEIPALTLPVDDPQVGEIVELCHRFLSQHSVIGKHLELGNSPEHLLDAVACFGHLPTNARIEVLEADTWGGRVRAVMPYLRQFEAMHRDANVSAQPRLSSLRAVDFVALAEDVAIRMQSFGITGETVSTARRRLESLAMRAHDHDSAAASLLEYARSLPWDAPIDAEFDLQYATQMLDQEHVGGNALKSRVIEELVVRDHLRKRGGAVKGTLLCFAGAPGTGKTSMARLLAATLNRPFARVALGGVSEAHSLRGTPSQYKRSCPGLILDAIHSSGSFAPVILLDELDKLGGASGENGDPAEALLAMLDPEQQAFWKDAYLDLPTPLSHVVFIATVNALESVPEAIRDRLEVIDVPPYTASDRFAIVKRALLPRALDGYNLSSSDIRVTDDALWALVAMTSEPGVRQLDRDIQALIRKAVVYGVDHAAPVVIDAGLATEWIRPHLNRRHPIGFRLQQLGAGEESSLSVAAATPQEYTPAMSTRSEPVAKTPTPNTLVPSFIEVSSACPEARPSLTLRDDHG